MGLEISWSMFGAVSAVVVFIGKVAIDMKTIGDLKATNENQEGRIDELEKEQLRITEALDRSYANKEYIFEMFITRKEFTDNIGHIEEKLVQEMKHISKAIEDLAKTVAAQKEPV